MHAGIAVVVGVAAAVAACMRTDSTPHHCPGSPPRRTAPGTLSPRPGTQSSWLLPQSQQAPTLTTPTNERPRSRCCHLGGERGVSWVDGFQSEACGGRCKVRHIFNGKNNNNTES